MNASICYIYVVGKDIGSLICNVGAGAVSGAAAASGGGTAATGETEEAAPVEEKKEEKEESGSSDEDMGFGKLFE